MKKVKILGVQFDACTKDEALARIIDCLEHRSHEGPKQIVTPNPEMLLAAQHNENFMETLNHTWLSIPDGIGILWAATFQEITKQSGRFMSWVKGILSLLSLVFWPRYCKKVLPERVTGVDLMQLICAVSCQFHTPIFLLGAAPGVAEKVKKLFEEHYRGINIVGAFSGSPREDDFPAIHSLLAETRPEIIFVAYGAPAQEQWIAQHLHELKSVKIAMGVGGAFDFLSGVRKRAPKWMQKLGLEWLYRLIQEPKRIKRIWNATVKFPLKILRSQ